MIVELVRFKAPPDATWSSILDDAQPSVAKWRANEELLRKHYIRDDEGNIGGIYVWPSREAAQKAHDAAWCASIEKRIGSPPSFAYFDLMILLDNEAGNVTTWNEDGSKQAG